jgi:hypothetical protein
LPKNYNGRRGPRIPPLSPELKRIYRIVTRKIFTWGYNIYVTDSLQTRSRYLKVLGKKKIIIRLSDHPSRKPWGYDFDVYTGNPRRNAITHEQLIEKLEPILKKGRTHKSKTLQNPTNSGDSNG